MMSIIINPKNDKRLRGLTTSELRTVDYKQCKRAEIQHDENLKYYRRGLSRLKLSLGGFLNESRYYWGRDNVDG